MNCEDIIDITFSGESGVIDDAERDSMAEHVRHCQSCQDALRGVESMRLLKYRAVDDPDAALFARLMGDVRRRAAQRRKQDRGFWLGAGVGGAVAAAVFAAVVTLGPLQGPKTVAATTAEFLVSTTEPRDLNIAIDANTDLTGATVSITFYGGVELAGYARQRHLSWITDLDAGINKLSLPILALDQDGGQVIVQLDHPLSHQEFLVQLRNEG
jgi:hypothetical protein